MILPLPRFYKDWKDWAAAVLRALERADEVGTLPTYQSGALPKGRDGQLIFIAGIGPAYYMSGSWRRSSTDGVVT